MLKFALGVVTGVAVTVAVGAVQVVRAEEADTPFETPAEVINRLVLLKRKQLLSNLIHGSRVPSEIEKLHQHYKNETARLDAIYYGQLSEDSQ